MDDNLLMGDDDFSATASAAAAAASAAAAAAAAIRSLSCLFLVPSLLLISVALLFTVPSWCALLCHHAFLGPRAAT